MARKSIRTQFDSPIVIDGRYRVTVVRRGRTVEIITETIEMVDGVPVYVQAKGGLEILTVRGRGDML